MNNLAFLMGFILSVQLLEILEDKESVHSGTHPISFQELSQTYKRITEYMGGFVREIF